VFYLLRIYGRGVSDVAAELRPLLAGASAAKAMEYPRSDFANPDAIGPSRAAGFLCGRPDAAIQADAAGFVRGIRSFRVSHPFDRHLIFYRFDGSTLYAERVVHGMRDLPRRLVEPPEADAD
jgi:hypothetical protein